MLRSMTGYGSATGTGAADGLRIEIRSVNHRHLQLKTRLPGPLSFLEPDLEALVRKALERGAVTLTVTGTIAAPAELAHVDAAVARRYREMLSALARDAGLSDDLSLRDLLAMPGVLTTADPQEVYRAATKPLVAAVKEAVEHLLAMRTVEGEAIEKDLRRHAKMLSRLVGRIAKRMPRVVREQQAALKRRVEDLLGGGKLREADLAREIALLSDRADVSEELARIESHLAQLDGVLGDAKGCVGRKLDFLVQELFREVNTIGSKCGDATVAHWVIDMKTTIERLREQVQNVE